MTKDVRRFMRDVEQARQDIIKMIVDPTVNVTGGELTAEWTARVEMLLVELLGPALLVLPCRSALCTGGSLARQEACAYSDLECFVLLQDDQEKNRMIVREAAVRAGTILMEAGEAGRGFSFDDALTPRTWAWTPRHMLEFVQMEVEAVANYKIKDRALLDVLHDHRLVMGDRELYEDWSKLAAEFSASMQTWELASSARDQALREWRQWMTVQHQRPDGARRPDLKDVEIRIKDHYYRWLQKIPKFLCQYYGLAMGDTRAEVAALQRHGHISKPVEMLFLDCLDKVTRLRMTAHLHAGSHQAGDSLLAGWALANAPQTVTHMQVAGRLARKPILKSAGLIIDLVPKINALVTMAEDFLEWAQTNDAEVTIDTSGKTGMAKDVRRLRKDVRGNLRMFRENPFTTNSPNTYKRMYSWSESVLLPTNAI